jgi:MFS transporter, OFA family, oxalate/formate antiporter
MTIKERWNNIPFSPARIPFFYGWVILLASTVGVLASAPGQTMGVSTFTDYLIENIRINRNQISTAYLIGTVGSSFLLTWAGRQYDKYGSRWTAMAAASILATVLLLLSQSDRLIRVFVKDYESVIYNVVAIGFMIVLFFMLRFSGQGVLTMVSRNMLMKWFIARRGFANGIASVFVALGFSIAPLTFDGLIQATSWRYAWIIMAVAIGVFFMLFAFVLFRDNPEDVGMIPDGEKHGHREHNVTIRPFKQFTLKEARRTLPFWLFTLPLAMYSLYITGFTFHLISIFEGANMDREKALAVFIPISFISVGISFVGGWISDRIRLKYLLFFVLTGELIALTSLANLNDTIFYYGFILGHAMVSGLFNVLMTVTWPRFYGRRNLGSITGFVMSITVFSSALGPLLFSFSYTRLGSYSYAGYFLVALVVVLLSLSNKGNNPQDKFENEESND